MWSLTVHTYGLSDVVNVVFDLQVGQLLLHLQCQFIWSEAHGIDVVCPHAEEVWGSLHDLQGGAQAVVDVHHGQPCVWLQVALKLPGLDGIMKNLNCIVYKEKWQGDLALIFNT